MTQIVGETVRLGQADGSEVELVVSGDEDYARYETPAGHSVIYDEAQGTFFYARLAGGRLVSTGVPAGQPPPPGAALHAEESPEVRLERAEAARARRRDRQR
jgi:hypothetical protein